MTKKHLIVPMGLALHTKLKWKCRQEGLSMSEAVRQLVGGYVNDTVVLGDPEVQISRPTVHVEPPDVYEQLAAKVTEKLAH